MDAGRDVAGCSGLASCASTDRSRARARYGIPRWNPADDNPAQPEAYRPHTAPGQYVPTAAPAIPQWPQRKPWLMASASQFRPGPPPALAGERWARDFNEVRELGAYIVFTAPTYELAIRVPKGSQKRAQKWVSEFNTYQMNGRLPI